MLKKVCDDVYRPPRQCTDALSVVGITKQACAEAVSAIHPSATGYLVGSLAFGFGNAQSDVDIHVFVSNEKYAHDANKTVTRLSWHKGVTVDLDIQPPYALKHLQAAVDKLEVVSTSIGLCALGDRQAAIERRRLSRWLNALPFDESSGDLIKGASRQRALAWLRRDALEAALKSMGLATLASRSGTEQGERAAQYMWARTQHTFAELMVRIAGDVTTGSKWMRAAVRRHDLWVPEVEMIMSSTAIFQALGLSIRDPLRLLEAVPARENISFRLQGREFTASRQGTAICHGQVTGGLDAIVEGGQAFQLFQEVGAGLVNIVVRRNALDEELRL